MKVPSLRLRLALLSSALAGGVLVGFALLSGWLTYQAKLDRLDAQLLNSLASVGRPRNGDPRVSPDIALAQELGLSDSSAVALVVIDRNQTLRYQSPHWPPDLALTALGPAFSAAASPIDSTPTDPWPGRPAPDDSRDLPPISQQPMPMMRRGMEFDLATVGPLTAVGAGERWRIAGRVTPLGRVAIAVSLQAVHQEMGTLLQIYWLTIPGALALLAGGSWWLAGRALDSIQTLSHRITQVTAQGLHQRVPQAGSDREFQPLIAAFNAMLERLERSFHQASRFSGDAAHELKTPLAILQGELEQAMQQAEAGSPLQQTLGHLMDEVSRLSGIVRKLLLLSLADAGQMGLRREPVAMEALLAEQLEDLSLLAPDLTITQSVAGELWVKGDRDLLIQVLQNLLSNAIKYNLPQGWIRVEGRQQSGQVRITIANAAQRLSADDQARLFDRFYRGDPARTRTTDGLGLGLSLAREIARAHGGEVRLDLATATEVQFELTLPAA